MSEWTDRGGMGGLVPVFNRQRCWQFYEEGRREWMEHVIDEMSG